jgi:hypothetical protein
MLQHFDFSWVSKKLNETANEKLSPIRLKKRTPSAKSESLDRLCPSVRRQENQLIV